MNNLHQIPMPNCNEPIYDAIRVVSAMVPMRDRFVNIVSAPSENNARISDAVSLFISTEIIQPVSALIDQLSDAIKSASANPRSEKDFDVIIKFVKDVKEFSFSYKKATREIEQTMGFCGNVHTFLMIHASNAQFEPPIMMAPVNPVNMNPINSPYFWTNRNPGMPLAPEQINPAEFGPNGGHGNHYGAPQGFTPFGYTSFTNNTTEIFMTSKFMITLPPAVIDFIFSQEATLSGDTDDTHCMAGITIALGAVPHEFSQLKSTSSDILSKNLTRIRNYFKAVKILINTIGLKNFEEIKKECSVRLSQLVPVYNIANYIATRLAVDPQHNQLLGEYIYMKITSENLQSSTSSETHVKTPIDYGAVWLANNDFLQFVIRNESTILADWKQVLSVGMTPSDKYSEYSEILNSSALTQIVNYLQTMSNDYNNLADAIGSELVVRVNDAITKGGTFEDVSPMITKLVFNSCDGRVKHAKALAKYIYYKLKNEF